MDKKYVIGGSILGILLITVLVSTLYIADYKQILSDNPNDDLFLLSFNNTDKIELLGRSQTHDFIRWKYENGASKMYLGSDLSATSIWKLFEGNKQITYNVKYPQKIDFNEIYGRATIIQKIDYFNDSNHVNLVGTLTRKIEIIPRTNKETIIFEPINQFKKYQLIWEINNLNEAVAYDFLKNNEFNKNINNEYIIDWSDYRDITEAREYTNSKIKIRYQSKAGEQVIDPIIGELPLELPYKFLPEEDKDGNSITYQDFSYTINYPKQQEDYIKATDFPIYLKEDGGTKKIENAKSFMNQPNIGCFTEEDENTTAKCIEGNATSKIIEYGIKNPDLIGELIPLKTLEYNSSFNISDYDKLTKFLTNEQKTSLEESMKYIISDKEFLTFSSINEKKIVTRYSDINEIEKLGLASTTITFRANSTDCRDSYFNQDNANNNAGAITTLIVGKGSGGGNAHSTFLCYFNNSIDTTRKIEEVNLSFFHMVLGDTQYNGFNVELYTINGTQDWQEGTGAGNDCLGLDPPGDASTWNELKCVSNIAWITAGLGSGTDRNASNSSEFFVTDIRQNITLSFYANGTDKSLVQDVQWMLNNPDLDKGWVMIQGADTETNENYVMGSANDVGGSAPEWIIRSSSEPSTPDLHLPENNTLLPLRVLTVELNWSNSTHPDNDIISYYLEVWNDTDATGEMYINNSISETINTTSDIVTFPNEANDYFWRVLSTNGDHNSSFSELRNISISPNFVPSQPTLNKPDNDSKFNVIQEFNWSNSTDENNVVSDVDYLVYYIEIDNNDDFTSPEYINNSINETDNTTEDTGIVLPSANIYFWRVLATDNIVNSSWSETRQFTFDNSTPLPYITSPTNTTYSDSLIDLNWSVEDLTLDSTWYSDDNGLTNTTLSSNISVVWNVSANTIYLWANDSFGLENFTTLAFTISLISTDLYLDGLTQPRKYEYGTTANITAIINNCDTCEVCLSTNIIAGLDGNISCGIGATNYSWLVGDVVIQNFSNSDLTTNDSLLNLTFSSNPQSFNITFPDNITFSQFTMNITGNINSNNYPSDLVCDLEDDGDFDFNLPGNLTNNIVHQDRFTNGRSEETLSYSTAGSLTRFLNYTTNLGTSYTNLTMNLSGGRNNPEAADFKDFFYNNTNINTTNWFVRDDFSAGDTGKWSGSYTVTTNTSVADSGTVSTTSCTASTDSGSFESTHLNLEDYGSTIFKATISSNGDVQYPTSGGCSPNNAASGTATFKLKDKTDGSTTILKSVSCLTGQGSVGTDSCTSSDTSTWEIRKVNNNFEIYDDSVLAQTISFNSIHQYEVVFDFTASATKGSCPGCNSLGPDIGSQFVSSVTLNAINQTGIVGTDLGGLKYGNASVQSSTIQSFTSSISSARLDVDYNAPTNTIAKFYLSANGGTNWEEVQDNIAHVFTTQGTDLRWKTDVSSTEEVDDGTLNTAAIVRSANLVVSSSYPDNLSIDVGADGTDDFVINENITDQQDYSINVSSAYISRYVFNNCQNRIDCAVPLAISVGSAGELNLNSIDANTTIETLSFSNLLSNLSNFTTLNTQLNNYCISGTNGIARLQDLDLRYIGEENITVEAVVSDNASIRDEETITIRYSNFSRTLPKGANTWTIYPSNFTAYNVTPSGQEINFCDASNATYGYCSNVSVPVFNITNLAKIDPLDLYVKLNESLVSCINLSIANSVVNSDSFIINTSEQKVLDDFILTNSTGLYMWADLVGCNSSSVRYFNPLLLFNSYCDTCVY